MKQVNLKKLLIPNLPYVLIGVYASKIGQAYRLAAGADLPEKLRHIGEGFAAAFASPYPSFHLQDLAIGLLCGAALRLAVYVRGKNAKKYRKDVEYGSARWGNAADIQPFVDPVFENNIILTQTERLMMSNRPKQPKYARNKNVLIIGGSGSGKTRFWLKPNLMQCTSKDFPTSFVVTDPKGSIVCECGKLLQRNQYQIKILNTINFKKSMHYNPFAYIHSEKDILKLVTTLIANTKGEQKGGDEFWTKAETLLYCALIGYIHYEAPVEEQNFSTLIEFINAMEVREDDEEFKNPVDLMFEELAEREPNHFAVRQYAKYRLAAGKTAKSILVSCGARLAPFDIKELRELTAYDELELDTLGDQKTALFIIMSDTDDTFNFLISMCYTQLFNLLCEKADDVYGGRLPVHVRCLIDEAANIGQIPKLEKLVATIRSREISCCLVLQAQSQLKALYKDNCDTIIGNMDARIFLGGSEPTTLKELSAALGKETIDMYNTSVTKGTQESHGQNFQKLGKELASIDELAVLDGSKCILQLRGVRPFLSDKYDITKHPNYKYLSDFDKKNAFNIERFLSTKLKLKPGEKFEAFEIDTSGGEADPT
uniref:Type IV secretion system protein VirD4 n=1 Tax=Eubacterium plexicaudatum ASF492 TaxID=1235802 RepID=N2ACV7_9FIRM